jgi:hypothetical protein
MKNPLEARSALRRGDRLGACQILGAFVEELLDTDNMYVAKNACAEFVHLMVTVDDLPAAACVLGFLEAGGVLDLPAFRSLVAKDSKRIAADATVEAHRQAGRELDDRRALLYMRDVLDGMTRSGGEHGDADDARRGAQGLDRVRLDR